MRKQAKHPSVAKMRDVMASQPPPFYFLTLSERELRCIAAGKLTASMEARAREQVTELEAQGLGIEQQAAPNA